MKAKKSSLFFFFPIIILIFVASLFFSRHGKNKSATEPPLETNPPNRRNEVVKAIEKALPSVVNIGTEHVLDSQNIFESDDFSILQRMFDKFLQSQKSAANYSLGSGCIIDPSGLIVTNAHVVERAAKIMITFNGGRNYEAEMIAGSQLHDIALLKMKDPPPALQAIQCDNSGKLYLGETVIAVGNPFGLDSSITVGALSGTRRRFTYQGHVIFSDILQTDAIVYPGNSGGPLINIEGKMIGMNMSSYENAPGIGFAIPLSRIENVLAKWMLPERFGFCSLGIVPGWKKDEIGQRTIIVEDVLPGSPAAQAGVRKGIRIFRFNGQATNDLLALSRRLIRLRPGDEAVIDTAAGKYHLKIQKLSYGNPLRTAREKLGLVLTPVTPMLAKELGCPTDSGLIVTERLPDAPSEIQRGDILLQLDSSSIHSAKELAAKMKTLHYRDTVTAVFLTTVTYQGKKYLAKRKVTLSVR